jgi:hypothetical protein
MIYDNPYRQFFLIYAWFSLADIGISDAAVEKRKARLREIVLFILRSASKILSRSYAQHSKILGAVPGPRKMGKEQ